MNIKYVIYKINFPNNKVYIGLTKNLRKRIDSHMHSSNSKKSRPIFNAIKVFKDYLTFEILEKDLNLNQAEEFEKKYIKQYNSDNIQFGYNLSPGGSSGSIMSESGKQKWKEQMQKHFSNPEYIEKIRQNRLNSIKKDPKSFSEKMRNNINGYFSKAENRKKHSELLKQVNSKREKRLKLAKSHGMTPFICNETGEVFNMLQDAADKFGVDKRRISAVLNNPKRYKTVLKKYTFKYIEIKE